MSIKIDRVDAGSEAEALGLAGGDELLSVDGNELNDTLDYDFYTDSKSFHLKARVADGIRECALLQCAASVRAVIIRKRENIPIWIRPVHSALRRMWNIVSVFSRAFGELPFWMQEMCGCCAKTESFWLMEKKHVPIHNCV